MSYLVRRIDRKVWSRSECDQSGRTIMGDIVANCVRPQMSELSVWYAADVAGVELAKLALVASMDKLAAMHYVVLDQAALEAAGFSIRNTPSQKVPASLRGLHRDIAPIDMGNLDSVARIVQSQLVDSREELLTLDGGFQMLSDAIEAGRFALTDLNRKLREAYTAFVPAVA